MNISTMSTIEVNGVRLHVSEAGAGEPLVLVHGSWVDRQSWAAVEEDLARSFHVFSYDRRGHSGSSDGAWPGERRDDEEDLSALIEALGVGPVHVVANSFGTSVALGTAARRPDLVRSVCGHEPPLVGLIPDNPAVRQVGAAFASVVQIIGTGDHEAAARTFTEIVVGPGAFDDMSADEQAVMIGNARAFAGETQQPDFAIVDLDALAAADIPVLLSQGGQSPPLFRAIVARIAGAVPDVRVRTFADAGHVPHRTHAEEYVAAVTEWVAGHASRG